MPTFERAPVDELAEALLTEGHHGTLNGVEPKLDFVFAYGDEDSQGNKKPAITKNGLKCLGVTKLISLKERVLGRGDAEVMLDGDWWKDATYDQRLALLDHELYHLKPTGETDDVGRPLLRLRKHDIDLGFFSVIAVRHGENSMERIQAKQAMDLYGQYFWPELADKETAKR